MRIFGPLLLVSIALCCMLASRTSAGVFDPTLPAAFESFAAATGESVVQNAGASAGVIGGQVEGIGGA